MIPSWQLTHEENQFMKTILLSSAAALMLSTSLSFAGVPALDDALVASPNGFVHLAKDGGGGDGGNSGSGGGGGGNSGSGGGNSSDDGDDSGDDHGGGHHGGDDSDDDNDNDDDSNDDNNASGRDKPRIPGGSGCDDPGDVAEHAACRAQ
jgi:hypothetical protein